MKKDGGPAFPHEYGDACPGMTLRDYFAAKAMQGLLACPVDGRDLKTGKLWECTADRVAAAYSYADAMLAERDK